MTLADGTSATLTDVVLEGSTIQNITSTAGVRAGANAHAVFDRALVKGFQTGLHLANSEYIHVEDSVVRANQIGVRVEGADPSASCAANPPAPQRWRDPVFTHSDIVDNTQGGLSIYGSDVLIQVDASNIIRNGQFGVQIMGRTLNPLSFIRGNNIHGNGSGNGAQVLTYHWQSGGVLDISGNYWSFVSDPELSQSWQFVCSGQRTFTGFSPSPITGAGPRVDKLIDPVKQQTWQQQH